MGTVGDKIPGLVSEVFALSPKSRSGGRKSGSLARFTGEGIEGTGDRDDALDEALDEVGESGGGSMISRARDTKQEVKLKTTKFPRKSCSRDPHMTDVTF